MKGKLNNQNNKVQKKEKYGMRKLSVGFVSCMLGAVMVFSSVGGSFAAGAPTPQAAPAKQEEKVEQDLATMKEKEKNVLKLILAQKIAEINYNKEITDAEKKTKVKAEEKKFNEYKKEVDKAKTVEELKEAIKRVAEDFVAELIINLNDKKAALQTEINNRNDLSKEQKDKFVKALGDVVKDFNNRSDKIDTVDKAIQFSKELDKALEDVMFRAKALTEKDKNDIILGLNEKKLEINNYIINSKKLTDKQKKDYEKILSEDLEGLQKRIMVAELGEDAEAIVNDFGKSLQETKKAIQYVEKMNVVTPEEQAKVILKALGQRDKLIEEIKNDKELTTEQKKSLDTKARDDFRKYRELAEKDGILRPELEEANSKYQEDIKSVKDAIAEAKKLTDEERKTIISDLVSKKRVLSGKIEDSKLLTQKQKEEFQKEFREEFLKLQDDIMNAKTKKQAKDIAEAYEKKLDQNTKTVEDAEKATLEAAKKQAKADLDKEATEAIETINANDKLTVAQKKNLVDYVEAVKSKTTNNIDAATDLAKVMEAKDEGIKFINDVVKESNKDKEDALEDARNQANLDLDEVVDKAIDTINANKKINEAQKKEYVEKVEAIEDETENNIEAATDVNKVKEALDEGIKRINEVVKESNKDKEDALEDARNQANLDLDEVVDKAIDTINANKKINEAQKKEYVDKVEAVEDKAEDDIEKATTPEQVKTILEKAKKDIKAITDKLPGGGSGGYSGGGGSSVVDTPSVPSNRISGSDRIQTAVEVSKLLKNSKAVVLANKDTYSDVLSATPFAHQIEASILLTNAQATPQKTLDEIKRLGVEKVYIIGGQSTVTTAQEDNLKKLYKVERINGSDRYETSAKIAEKMLANGSKSVVEVASGEVFADALSLTSKANKDNAPILLVKKDALPKVIADFAKKYQATNITVAGGTSTVTNAVVNTIKLNSAKDAQVTRLNGRDRYETAIAIAKATMENSTKGIYTSGEIFADALVAGTYATQVDAPVLLVKKTSLPASVAKYNKESKITEFEIIGGNSSVSDATFEAIKTSLNR